MSDEYNYFLVKGGVVKTRLEDFFKTRLAQFEARKQFVREHGGTGSLGKSHSLVGVQFLNVPVPAGWIPVSGYEGFYKPRKSKATAPVLAKMKELPLYGYQELQYAVLGEEDHFRFMAGMNIQFLSYEKIGESEVLKVPKIEEKPVDEGSIEATTNWTPPDDGCVAIKTSEYFALKEAQEATA